MRTHNYECTPPDELSEQPQDAPAGDHVNPGESPRLAAKAVLRLLRTRRHMLSLPPAAAHDHEQPGRQR